MRNHRRARRWALTVLCTGTTFGAAGLAVVPGEALATTPPKVACSDVTASGSTLQTPVQENTFTLDAAKDKAFTNCTSAPSVYYNTTGDDSTPAPNSGTGSGTGLKEFGASGALTPADASNSESEGGEINGGWLDGFVGSDAAPTSAQMSEMESASNTNPEAVPVLQAPVAVIVKLPAGCTIKAAPKITNTDLLAAWENDSDWTTLLHDAGATPSNCGSATPTLEARNDSSGTTLAFRDYLYQVDSANGGSTYPSTPTTSATWPSGVTVHENDDPNGQDTPTCSGATPNCGSEGEADAVTATSGSMGYVNAADGNLYDGFTNWKKGATTFWVEVQNNGATSPKAGTPPAKNTLKAAYPVVNSTQGNCYSDYTGALPSGNSPDWENVFVQNPKQKSDTTYPICTLTYDVAWEDYVGDSTLASYYQGNYTGETPAAVEDTTRDYLTWVVALGTTRGQGLVPHYYTKLPPTIQKVAASTVSSYVGIG